MIIEFMSYPATVSHALVTLFLYAEGFWRDHTERLHSFSYCPLCMYCCTVRGLL